MNRLLKFLNDNSIDYERVDNYLQINNYDIRDYIRIFKFEHPLYDYLYVLVRPKESNFAYVYAYSYLVNIYIRNFVLEK